MGGGSYEPPPFCKKFDRDNNMKKKALILQWNSVNDNKAITRSFQRMGMEFSIVDLNGQDCRDNHTDFFMDFLKKNRYDLVYSTNYFDYLGETCHRYGVPYLAWTYDSPAKLDDIEKLKYDTTSVFLFDSREVSMYKERNGLKNIHYLPLAADIERFDESLSEKYDTKEFSAEISFVGTLYDSMINEYLNSLSDYHKGMFNAVVDNCIWKYDECIAETLNAEDFFYWGDEEEFNKSIINDKRAGELILKDDKAGQISSRVARMAINSVTNRERLLLVSMLSKHWNFKLYSTSSHEVLKTVIECGGVDYYTDMPRVFRNSKINLNITNKGIKTGIPLRCMDIMGCRGVLLTNYQKDFEEHFRDGYNVLLYRTPEEAYDKCKFYLEHDDQRRKISNNGYETVKKHYNYDTLLNKAIEMAGLGYLKK